jgi:hypothetical protein
VVYRTVSSYYLLVCGSDLLFSSLTTRVISLNIEHRTASSGLVHTSGFLPPKLSVERTGAQAQPYISRDYLMTRIDTHFLHKI